jgi:hypothetical protein
MHVRRQYQFSSSRYIYRDRNAARAHSWAWAARRTSACMRHCRHTNYFCPHIWVLLGLGGSVHQAWVQARALHTWVDSWHQAHEHEASNTHTHIHSATSLSLSLSLSLSIYLSQTHTDTAALLRSPVAVCPSSSVTPHGVTCFWTYNYFSQLFLQKKSFSTIVYTEYDVDSREPRKTGFHNL